MLIDVARPLTNLKGVIQREDNEPVTVGNIIATYVCVLPTEGNLPANERKRRFLMATKVFCAEGSIDLDDADIELVKKVLNASQLPPLYTEQVMLALEGKPNPLAKEADVVKLRA